MYILGISAFYHDSSVTLLKDGKIIFALEEERFTRIKHDKSFPYQSIKYCLDKENININDISYIGYYEYPIIKFRRILSSYISNFPKGFNSFFQATPKWISENLWIKSIIKKNLDYSGKIVLCAHHTSHVASAYFPSPYQDSAILSMDGVGEWNTVALAHGNKNRINNIKNLNFPHSIGLLYSAFTYYCGFKVNSGEYKLMGLAPYGKPKYFSKILENLIDLKDDGSFKIDMSYFDYSLNINMLNEKFYQLFDKKNRNPESEISQFYMDIASSIQKVIELIIIKITKHLKEITQSKNLCISGGVGLNCVANYKILKENIFENIWVQPASGDSGGSLGSAMYVWYQHLKNDKEETKKFDFQQGSYLGSKYSNDEINIFISKNKIPFEKLDERSMNKKIAHLLDSKNVIGRFVGKMEFGPRALGNRSILANPLDKEIQQKLNIKIKHRESFRPFAPAVLCDKFSEFFDFNSQKKLNISPYMLFVCMVKGFKKNDLEKYDWRELLKNNNSPLPGITHVDGTARVQTVHRETNESFYNLINSFYILSGCPVVINTSFNVRGEPIVESPKQAYDCFMNTDMDYLILENYLISKKDQPTSNRIKKIFELD